jgi:putative selenium metabolism protein SsnA
MYALKGATLIDFADPAGNSGALRMQHGTLVIDDVIVEVAVTPPPGVTVLDCSGMIVMPGLVLGHTHLYSALARGMPLKHGIPTNFTETLERIWWPLDLAIDQDILHASAFVGVAEALRSGVTTVYDHHASPRFIDGSLDVLAGAFETLGARGVLCYETTDRNGKDGGKAGIAENLRFARKVKGSHRLAALLGAHASFTLEDDTLAELMALRRSEGLGLHIHVAEDAADNADAVRRGAGSAAARLLAAAQRAGGIGDDRPLSGALMAHLVHASDIELERLAHAGARFAHNARSNLNNAVGHGRLLTDARSAALPVALGTDGIGADLFEETRVAFYKGREAHVPPAPRGTGEGFGADRIVAMLAQGQAMARRDLGLPFGTLDAGAPADLVVLDYPQAAPVSAANFAYHLIFGGVGPAHVRHVFVGGEQVVRDHQLARVDAQALYADAKAQAARLWERI